MNKEETDLVVSILNLVLENLGYDVDKIGFGYDDKTLKIDTLEDCSLKESLEILFSELSQEYKIVRRV